jgi:hypothetical protein
MKAKIQLKRGASNQLPSLDVGEPGFCTDTNEIYVGTAVGNKKVTSLNEIGNLSIFINPLAYGCKGDGATDDTTNLQSAVNDAISKKIPLQIPTNKNFLINSPITINGTLVVAGSNRHQALITAGSTMDAMFSLTANIESPNLYGFGLQGSGKANYGIKQASGVTLSHAHIKDLLITGTNIDAVQINDGWCNEIYLNEIQSNNGNGITVVTGSTFQSALNIMNNKIYANSGVGVLLNAPISKGNIKFNTIETNAKCGVYSVYDAFHLSIDDNRFESNSQTGYTFTSPAETIQADIIINGLNNPTSFGYTYPAKNVSIENNFTTGCPILAYLIAVNDVSIKNNFDNQGTATVLKLNGDTTKSQVQNVRLELNDSFATPISIENIQQYEGMLLSTFYMDNVPKKNYITPDFLEYAQTFAYNGGTIVKGDISYDGFDTFLISGTASGFSAQWGVTLDMSQYPELAGQTVYFAVKTKCALGTGVAGPALYVSGTGFSRNSYVFNSNWNIEQIQVTLPTTGTVQFTFGTVGNTSGGEKIYFANPVLTVVGNPYTEHYKTIQPPVYKANSAPTTGTWEVGKQVLKLTPTVGQPKAWVCTVAGTPGTWVSEGNL